MSETLPPPTRIVLNYKPRPWQMAIHRQLKRFNVLVIHRGAGKDLALDTLIATPEGFTTMGEIAVGDQVIDRDGNICNVVAVSETFNHECFEVEFSTGEVFVTGADHLWLTQSIREKQAEKNRVNPRNRRENPKNTNNPRGKFYASVESAKTTNQIRDTLVESYISKDGFRQRNHRVRVVEPLHLPKRDLPLDPYWLGYWLGDGTTNTGDITVGEQDQPAFCEQKTARDIPVKYRGNLKFHSGPNGNTKGNKKTCYKALLRDIGVLGNKHIPTIYLRSSLIDRWLLLQGLMDSDGCTSNLGHCEYTSVRRNLAEDVQELVASLGLKPGKIRTKKTSIKGVRKNDAYRFGFKGFPYNEIFSLVRKQELLPEEKSYNYQRNRMIVDVRPTTSVPTKCISVDSPSSTYCIGRTFIPTHNTLLAINEMTMKALTGPPHAEYLYLGPLKNQMMRAVWEPLKALVAPIPNIYVNNNRLEIVFPNKARITILGADDPENLRGMHVHGMVIDEFGDMPQSIWPIVFPMTTNHSAWVIFIGTPKGRNAFYDKFMESQLPENHQHWFGTVMDWRKTKALRTEEISLARNTMSKDMFAQEYECDWTASNTGAYYSRHMTELRSNGNIVYDKPLYNPELEVHAAFDIGMRDYTAVWWFQNVRDTQTNKDVLHFIDFEQASNLGLSDWNDIILKKERDLGYRRGSMIFPHDIKVREWGANVSRIESAEKLGIFVEQCPNHTLEDGIEMVRQYLSLSKYDGRRCAEGIECLAQYREKTDKMGNGMGVPIKDGSDHAADSFRYAMVYAKQVMDKPLLIRAPFIRRR